MDRRKFLVISTLTPLAATFASSAAAHAAGHTFAFSADGSAFLLDGQPLQIRSGEMHPARIPVQYWRHRIQMAKAMGMNTIAVYVMWNYLEEKPGVFDLHTDRRDLAAFVGLCQAEGMWVLLRPGPYVCGEWDLGGLPPYLLANNPISLRVRSASDPHYMAAVTRYVNTLALVIAPLMAANGGPVLMLQIENEYGWYGSDVTYLAEIRQAWINAGINGPFYTEDSLSQVQAKHTTVPGGAIGVSNGDASKIASCRSSFPAVPALAGEVYPGWLRHWGESWYSETDISGALTGLMNGGLSFNIYVIHGGTNFGYWAGANANDDGSAYKPHITSYDYGAPINEQGQPTASYTAYRNLVTGYVGTLPAVPSRIPTIAVNGSRAMTPVAYASLWDNLPTPLPSAQTVNPQPMEMYGQNSGFMLYRRTLHGYTGATLNVTAVHDYATVFLNGAYQGGFSRPAIPSAYATPLNVTTGSTLALGTSTTSPTLDILVEGMGRDNFGHGNIDRKGITAQVSLTNAGGLDGVLTNWQSYALPVDEAYVARLNPVVSNPDRPGIFFRATVNLTQTGDTYVDMSGWTKGIVWVNGHNLGRYWSIGPQQRLYCPAPWLNVGENTVLILDLHQTQAQPITFEATAIAPSTAYVITNRRSGKVLDDPSGSTTQGTQLIQWTANGGSNQVWRAISAGAGISNLVNAQSGLLVDVQGRASADGTPIIQWPSNGGVNQQWRIVAADGYVKLVSVLTGKLIGVSGDSTADGATIVEQTDTGDISQHWSLSPR
ncbi:beta-galactosidase [Catenulispora rubra]|uniref:beta-galactosidase n=1 Tax=Catenulispora rubra TaxID=280293 RepID=UPI0018923673|nr:beta-galactosidase [Catenulispora rubra]